MATLRQSISASTAVLRRVPCGWDGLRFIVAAVLLVAAGLKAYQLATEPTIGTGLLDKRWLLMAAVEFELAFGFWLLAGILPKPSWAAAVACFSLFTCISLYKAFSGYATCGCFGPVRVSPWYTATLDLAIVLSLLRWRPAQSPSHVLTLQHFTAVLTVWFLVGVPAAFAMGNYTDTTLSDLGDVIGDGKVVVLEPEKWIGKRFPLLRHIDIGDKLKEGEWLVLLYHHDCSKCRKVIPQYKMLRQVSDSGGNRMMVALIEMPPYAMSSSNSVAHGGACFVGRLASAKEWFIETPVAIQLENGAVSEVKLQERLQPTNGLETRSGR